jgi:hypothetical protein
MKHIVNVTISNPAHEFVSMRRRQSTTNYMVEARDEAEAIFRASNHFKKLGHYVHNAVIVESTLNEGVDQIDESAKVGPENYHKSTDTVWHSVHHNGQEIGTIGTHSAQHVEKHGKWGFEDSRGYGRRHGEPEMNSKEEALDALVNRHKEYTKKKTNEEVKQTDEAMQVRAYDKNGKLVGNYRSMADAKKFKPGHNYKTVKENVEHIDEVNARHSPEAAQAVLTPTAKIVRAAVGKSARDKAATKKYARRVANISPDYSKKDVMDHLKNMGEEVELDEDALKAREQWMKAKGVSTGNPKADRARKVKRLMKSFPMKKEEVVNEKAPPGAKYERMVKHIKDKYSEDGTLTPKEKAIAYATAWKAKNSGK